MMNGRLGSPLNSTREIRGSSPVDTSIKPLLGSWRISSSTMLDSHTVDAITLPHPSGDIRDGVHVIDTVKSLREHLQTAIIIELATIPLYLFARYSILPGDHSGIGAGEVIRSVVQEEMLHLSLACNLLRSVGGTPMLYTAFPTYPLSMPHHTGDFILNLRKADESQLEVFVKIETPELRRAEPNPDYYDTVGQFYRAIEAAFQYLQNKGPLFDPVSKDFQLQGRDGVYSETETGGLVVVQCVNDAMRACEIIIDQGEGFDPRQNMYIDPFMDPGRTDVAHYFKFKAILTGRLPRCHSVKENPSTNELASHDPKLGNVSRLFDASYCFLLLCIEQTYAIADGPIRTGVTANYVGFMTNIIRRLAIFLVSQPYPLKGRTILNCAPAFNFYDFRPTWAKSKPLQQVKDLADIMVEAYGCDVPKILKPIPTALGCFTELPLPIGAPYHNIPNGGE